MANSTGSVVVPKWVQFIVSVFGMGSLIWVTWVSATLIEIRVRIDMVDSVDSRLESHVADPEPHRATFERLNDRLSELRLDVEEIKAKLDRIEQNGARL